MIIFAVMLLYTPTAQAGSQTYVRGDQLFEICSLSDQTSIAYCTAYLIGVADIMKGGVTVAKHAACIPNNVTQLQLVKRVKSWLAKVPNRQLFSGWSIAAVALAKKFHC